ncbi:SusD/RagB family nutrient-binding outer membrane lipoprotein [Mucilaginibacter ginsenosidivorax]|uniref:SusD/RagB family nutrient-binding outer membrane lipoprotein n=1 Tax=Mucilaginibacter ginsenosidivorax TaxID=862126 RepID=A0A5B8W858_9SPHI|nr:SusD/RagB family nutrient-binding outer membrane lipoprotein [Mucilaginibacter ginsenosidivorax]QEC79871.1 SusD/RagB family nutrient-binding outer membrane lipoprotein [Mucilaginibacter ginsenosidivorax]
MKKRYIYSCLLAGATLFAGCSKNFDQVNVNPTKVSADLFNPNFLMAQAQIQFSNTGYDQLLFQSMWSQALASTYDYYGNGDKYVASGSFQDYKARTWNNGYSATTLIDEMKNLVKGNAAYSNLDNCGTILRVLMLERVTDAYGDIPFSQEGQAKTGIFTPVFDSQKDIYASMLDQLDKACAALDASKAGPTSDLFYSGNVSQWKKLGYSLMLRAAMRLTKVDAATAKTYAEKAYAGGTMASIADNAKVKADYTNGNGNSDAAALLVTDDFREVRWGKTLIDYMKSSADPRVSAVAEISAGTGKTANETKAAGVSTYALQTGMPNGYDLKGGTTDISKAPGYPGTSPADASVSGDAPAPVGKYSRPKFAVYDDRNRYNFLLTYGETELLLAEASFRGWSTGVAATHYANALKADMETLSQFGTTSVDAAAITAYVATHPLVAGTELQQINMEYYVETATVFNFNENWNNWKRSGFPVLTKVSYSNQFATDIPRRCDYPVTLPSTNGANYAAAVAKLSGGDSFTSRIYWDK